MSTDTTTTADTLGLSHGTLTLVTISADYFRDDSRAWSNGAILTDADDIGRTFYAAPSTDRDMVLVVEPRTSDRSIGMWSLGRDEAGVWLEDSHGGWNVPRSVVTPYGAATPVPGERLAYGSPVVAGERLAYDDERGAGDSFSPAERGDIGTVRHVDPTGDTVTITFDDGHESIRSRARFRRVLEGPQEATTGPQTADETTGGTFTQEDVDRLVREAREAKDAELAEWKEYANGIAVQYAKDNDLCGNFERCMTDIGLMGRNEWDESHKVTRYVTFRVEVQATPGEDLYTTRYNAADWLADRYANTIVDYATEVQDEDGDTLWGS